VPDLVHACLDLMIDRESGIWHLTNGTPLTWVALADKAALEAGIDTSRLEECPAAHFHYQAQRPSYSALATERAILLPPLDCAIGRFLGTRASPASLERGPAPGPLPVDTH